MNRENNKDKKDREFQWLKSRFFSEKIVEQEFLKNTQIRGERNLTRFTENSELAGRIAVIPTLTAIKKRTCEKVRFQSV